LIQSQEGLQVQPINTATSPTVAMAGWLIQTAQPETLGIDMDCVLVAADESKTKVKYVKHNLDIPEVKEHIAKDLFPESLALTWLNRVSFVFNADMTIKGVTLLDLPELEEGVDEFYASVCLITGELTGLVDDLIEELGGEIDNA